MTAHSWRCKTRSFTVLRDQYESLCTVQLFSLRDRTGVWAANSVKWYIKKYRAEKFQYLCGVWQCTFSRCRCNRLNSPPFTAVNTQVCCNSDDQHPVFDCSLDGIYEETKEPNGCQTCRNIGAHTTEEAMRPKYSFHMRTITQLSYQTVRTSHTQWLMYVLVFPGPLSQLYSLRWRTPEWAVAIRHRWSVVVGRHPIGGIPVDTRIQHGMKLRVPPICLKSENTCNVYEAHA